MVPFVLTSVDGRRSYRTSNDNNLLSILIEGLTGNEENITDAQLQ
jgi:hypothetical protein